MKLDGRRLRRVVHMVLHDAAGVAELGVVAAQRALERWGGQGEDAELQRLRGRLLWIESELDRLGKVARHLTELALPWNPTGSDQQELRERNDLAEHCLSNLVILTPMIDGRDRFEIGKRS